MALIPEHNCTHALGFAYIILLEEDTYGDGGSPDRFNMTSHHLLSPVIRMVSHAYGTHDIADGLGLNNLALLQHLDDTILAHFPTEAADVLHAIPPIVAIELVQFFLVQGACHLGGADGLRVGALAQQSFQMLPQNLLLVVVEDHASVLFWVASYVFFSASSGNDVSNAKELHKR